MASQFQSNLQHRSWQLLSHSLPPPQNHLVQCLVYLSSKQFSPSKVKSYIAGVSFWSLMYNFHDTIQPFMLKKDMIGLSRLDQRIDIYRTIYILRVYIYHRYVAQVMRQPCLQPSFDSFIW